MWVKIPLSQSYTTNSSNFIVGKNGNGIATINENLGGENQQNQPGILSQSFATSSKFPFEITTFNQTSANVGKINFSRRGGMFTPSTMTTQSFNDGEYHHIVAQRNTGSLEIYVDGVFTQVLLIVQTIILVMNQIYLLQVEVLVVMFGMILLVVL